MKTEFLNYLGSFDRAQGLQRLKQELENKLSKFRTHDVYIKYFGGCWFSNEYHDTSGENGLKLVDSYARLPTSKPLTNYSIAMITGEGGLFQGLPELAACCDLILQIDCDPNLLLFNALLLEECKKAKKSTDKTKVLEQAIARLRVANPRINEQDIDDIREGFDNYTRCMVLNLFSSAKRFAQFKACQDHPVQQLCLNYYSKEAMTDLAQTLRDHGAVVRFFNITNVFDYPMDFYENTPYDETKADVTPDQYVHCLPFADDAICAYSQFYGPRLFTATATIPEMTEVFYSSVISRRNRDLKALALLKQDLPLRMQLGGTQESEQPTLQLSTRIFQFFAKHSIETRHEWILRLTAARLTNAEIEELKVHKEAIRSLYLESHPTGTPESLPLKILDKITTEPTLAKSAPPVATATS